MSIIEKLGITPGLWEYNYHGTIGHVKAILNDGEKATPTVAILYGNNFPLPPEKYGETKGNGRLIATSPQVLEALIDLVLLKEYESIVDCQENGWPEKDAKGIARLEVASYLKIIESATGKSWEEIKALVEAPS